MLSDIYIDEDRDDTSVVGISQKDQKYQVYHPDNSNLWAIQIESGTLPKSLQGVYTTRGMATKEVVQYLEQVQKELRTSKNMANKPEGQVRKPFKCDTLQPLQNVPKITPKATSAKKKTVKKDK